MNAISVAQKGYASTSAPTRTPRSVEYEAVARITHRIRLAQQEGERGIPALVEALHVNRKLWTIFAADVADADNTLPSNLKADLFSLAEFTRHHTSKVLARQAPVEPLLEVNTAIMRGLRSGA